MQMMRRVLANRGRFSAVGGLRKATSRLMESVRILVSGSSVDTAEAKALNARYVEGVQLGVCDAYGHSVRSLSLHADTVGTWIASNMQTNSGKALGEGGGLLRLCDAF